MFIKFKKKTLDQNYTVMLPRRNVTQTKCYLDEMLLDEKLLDEMLLDEMLLTLSHSVINSSHF